jgi:uncharacterized membrane protein HdeD (DUF308 family)
MKILGPLSCVLAVLAILLWPFFNTIASALLALSAIVVGIVGATSARRATSSEVAWPSIVGTVLGGLVLLFWCGVMVIVLSGMAGHPF